MNITILAYLERGSTEPDAVVEQVQGPLKAAGHRTYVVTIQRDVTQLVHDVQASQPELVFNLVESFADAVAGRAPFLVAPNQMLDLIASFEAVLTSLKTRAPAHISG